MAVFLVNWCKFRGCGLTFATLGELIQHIEEMHINSDPRALERQESQHPPSLPLSYILRVFTDAARKEKKLRPSSVSPVPSFESNTPTGSEFDEDEVRSEDEDSNDSWTTQEEFTSELILSQSLLASKTLADFLQIYVKGTWECCGHPRQPATSM
ncbi:hypothetical protein LSAT2_025247 [Lamellibrachia satsuma]|nr:hypothetical protein LSAT2_025247 [Lamellibrachia satsuma]